ncbi:hypothetical protein MIZ01_2419 [Sideroxyarcus emersonii]|uniref:Uncharacterized protein n=1 Tax=Sideroxyarcus emersonii TaxID=2764705 RepID=A0AAN2BZV6_9PROT|nr:hypothetical protein [Sideroxyarcus emersonii]BCK88614.1 hypothetical protein MIZ01_2419 [Sideroxyarcus emersonii]
MKHRFLTGMVALLAGVALNHMGDKLLGVRLELFSGLSTFSFAWMVDIFIVPFIVGLVVSWIFGMGGKWLCYFPPLIVRSVSYAEILYVTGTPHGSTLNPMGWWGFYVILAMEAAGIGGIVGEVVIKNVYGRSSKAAQMDTQPAMEKES